MPCLALFSLRTSATLCSVAEVMRIIFPKLFFLIMVIGGSPSLSYSLTCAATPPLNLGTFARMDTSGGTYAVSVSGIVTNSSNIKAINPPPPIAGAYYCVENVGGNNGYYWEQPTCTQAITPSTCAATVAITFADPLGLGAVYNWAVKNGETRTVPYGISLSIPASCLPGTYTSYCTAILYGVNGKLATSATLGQLSFSFTVVPYLTVTAVTPLHFGVVASKPTPTQVVVSPNGSRSGSAWLMPQAPHATVAEFQISGTPNTSFSVALPSSVTLNGAGSATLSVGTFVPSTGTLSGLSTGPSGTTDLFVGGTLSIPANAPTGTYSGEYTVTITY